MNKKQIFTTIVCAITLTITTVQLWLGAWNMFDMPNDKIFLDIYLVFGGYLIAHILAWKSIFPKQGWLNLLWLDSLFQFFMLLISGWFASQSGFDNLSSFLALFCSYMIVASLSFVGLGCLFSWEQSSEKTKQPNQMIVAEAVSNLVEKEICIDKNVFLESLHASFGGKRYDG